MNDIHMGHAHLHTISLPFIPNHLAHSQPLMTVTPQRHTNHYIPLFHHMLTTPPLSPHFTTLRPSRNHYTIWSCSVLQELRKVILSGWPTRRSEVHTQPYDWSVRDSLVIDDGLIIRGTCVLIPSKLRQWYIDKLHEGHQGRFKMELRANNTLFWPGMKGDITARVDACLPCQTSGPANSKDEMSPERQHPVSPVPCTHKHKSP